ncbi:hypothetical protein Ciccas_013314 [Cichlidogyrus casuarinus]|uniref:Uncharacterized protein n=1 Tax=Cichlidogyrus casuarinus TaxID=1844966 RepID=A0ABD2PL14_9PLAT
MLGRASLPAKEALERLLEASEEEISQEESMRALCSFVSNQRVAYFDKWRQLLTFYRKLIDMNEFSKDRITLEYDTFSELKSQQDAGDAILQSFISLTFLCNLFRKENPYPRYPQFFKLLLRDQPTTEDLRKWTDEMIKDEKTPVVSQLFLIQPDKIKLLVEEVLKPSNKDALSGLSNARYAYEHALPSPKTEVFKDLLLWLAIVFLHPKTGSQQRLVELSYTVEQLKKTKCNDTKEAA